MRVLTVNAGSSSVKLSLLEVDASDPSGFGVARTYDDLDTALDGAPPDAVGHRVVHGGHGVSAPTRVTDEVLADLDALTPLAPLHQPAALDAMRRARQAWPDVPAVVCPDTAFHADLPASVATPAVPREWIDSFGLRRYGFHGLSVAWASRLVRRQHPDVRRLVVAHLGSGASLTAVQDGRSIDTTMGYTPMDGLVMATRGGSLDPGMVLEVVRRVGDLDVVARELETGSGLLGLAGTKDMREVLARRGDGDPACALAYAVYSHRLRSKLAAMVASLGGIDALVLTGGTGEGSATVRRTAVESLGHLGLRLNDAVNLGVGELMTSSGMVDVTGDGSSAFVLVVAAREDVEIARSTLEVLERTA